MKYLIQFLFLLSVLSACTKSETQYIDQSNKKETVNDKKSDTIQTLNEISDTTKLTKDSAVVR
ncbi:MULTISPECIES: hypothetical protein [Chryseobacterium]|uniref:hypothetical protein n=1 Tax=Chryseobacterium TaxID=59732 RepID=UPI0023585A2F|nr:MULTISPECIES: hypothetical protein [unclassified Chryseobacterium]MDC8104603.1 hypothetical protein [Chryseobacterium sp. B21-037]MDQ1806134.1 hypothetical protein [Chryseobacterium sp. CKR4-1]